MNKLFLLVLSILWSNLLIAQQIIGLPPVINYTRQQYPGGGQTWDLDMDRNGILYFANNEGLMTFNGHSWKLLPVPNHTRLRAVKTAKDGRIYIGAQDDFGYYLADADGVLRYTSLKPVVRNRKDQFADIWDIVIDDSGIFFRSTNKIFHYDHKTLHVYPAQAEWQVLRRAGGQLYAQDAARGLLRFRNGQWQPVCTAIASQRLLIREILDYGKDTLLICTLKNGLFKLHGGELLPFRTAADGIFTEKQIYCAKNWGDSDKQLLVGTSYGGCYIINSTTGHIIQRFTVDEGLQHNSVLKIFTDPARNIWLTLDNGIDMVRYNTAVKQILPDGQRYLTSYTAAIFKEQLYIGTSDGVFATPLGNRKDLSFQEGNFRRIRHTQGQVWNLSQIGSHLLMGHHEGAFEIDGQDARLVSKLTGSWLFRPFSSHILSGGYNGLQLIKEDGSQLGGAVRVRGLFESFRFLTVEDDSIVWSSHPYRGVFRMHVAEDSLLQYTLFTSKDGLPSDYNNFVFRIRNRTLVATQAGVYEYDARKRHFVPSPWLYPVLKNIPLQHLAEDATGNVWFVSDKMPGVIDFHKPLPEHPYSIVYFPELKGQVVSGFEFLYPYDDENIFVGAEKGMYHINYKHYRHSRELPVVLIGQVSAHGKRDSLLFGGYHPPGKHSFKAMPNAFSGFHFEYASPIYSQGNTIFYSYRLAGFDQGWSEWSVKTEKDYTNLPHGYYAFSVRAKDNLGNVSRPAVYAFRILPAWYQTGLAKSLYVLSGLALLLWGYIYQKKKFIRQRKRYQQKQEQLILRYRFEKEQREKDLISLQNEKLTAEVRFKNRELATATMYLLHRGKVLSNIKEELLSAMKKLDSPEGAFKKVMRLFEEAENNEEDWEQFSRHFDEVHNNFLFKLKRRYPELSTTDLKLCAYLRINLTTKEIAQSLGISVRGVETSRYRLRKKLELPAEVSLYDFLLAVADDQVRPAQS
ncbi:triple tyrosine motif-containing protein [Chitinophaga pinensis]|uniref:Two component regulator three Y domain protein n=1 Tax=Chitinophaga pinensis (strain ATCC 43595 / DSM 2588 / LMG 13176 / NBRC 15968 / NCIMB 11800 / UQM 2034) TaxID=485918 RepID=A0A979GRR7_CHIPD|nr:triple tyrosine motif-containing protein [Chitinophaga pinensis]ACU62542.1 Two component regulator three Y domain protein [Chitinophaga pinensis DSM 2588]